MAAEVLTGHDPTTGSNCLCPVTSPCLAFLVAFQPYPLRCDGRVQVVSKFNFCFHSFTLQGCVGVLTKMRLRTPREWHYFIMHRLFVFHTCSSLKIDRGFGIASLIRLSYLPHIEIPNAAFWILFAYLLASLRPNSISLACFLLLVFSPAGIFRFSKYTLTREYLQSGFGCSSLSIHV